MTTYQGVLVVPVDANGIPLVGGGAPSTWPGVPAVMLDANGNILTALTTSVAQGGGSVAVDASGNVTATVRAGSATAWVVQDTLSNPYWQTDTRVGVDGVSSHTIGNPNVGFAGAAGSKFHQIINSTFTLTLTGVTTVNALNGLAATIQAPTITNASAGTVANASTLSISGAPTVAGLAVVTHNYALDVVSGATHFGTATLGLGVDSDPGRVMNISGTLTGNPAAGQHGILMSLTSDGTFTGELVFFKTLLTASTAAANTVGRVGAFNVGAVVLPSGDTIQKYVGFSIDGGSGLGAGVTVNTYYGADMGSLANPSATVTDGSGGGGPTGLFVGYRVGAWAVTGSGTTTEYDGVLVKAPTLTTVALAYGIQIEAIAGATGSTTPTNFAIKTAGGAVSLTLTDAINSASNASWGGLILPAATLTIAGSTNITAAFGVNLVQIAAPTLSWATAHTITTAATVRIAGPPVGGGVGPATITNPYSLWVATGVTLLATLQTTGLLTQYNGVATAGLGTPAIYNRARVTGQTAANASILSFTSVAADATYSLYANILMTAFTAGTISMTVAYTDEGNTARTLTCSFEAIAGTLTTTPGAAGAFEGVMTCIRIKASTTVTVATTAAGFTGTYNAEATFAQVA